MNKKYMYSFVVLFAMVFVSATLLSHYGTMNADITVEQSVYLEGETVNLVGEDYDYITALDITDGVVCNDDACSATITTLSGKTVIFRADVVNKLQDDVLFDRLITVSNADGESELVANEVFVSYTYPANNVAGNGCFQSNSHFTTIVGSEMPMVTVGAYDGWSASPDEGYKLCVEKMISGTEEGELVNGNLVWTGVSLGWDSEKAYGIGRCGLDDVDDDIGCMNPSVDGLTGDSYDRPSYIVVEFPVATVGTYDVTFQMVPITA